MKAIREAGWRRVWRFATTGLLLGLLRLMCLPPLRAAFLRACGARIGANTILGRITFINVDRGGFRALTIGHSCFVGDEVLIDLAAPVTLEDHSTLAVRAMVLTHMNVGYRDHPLQRAYPSMTGDVTIRQGSFVGAGATILPGCSIGPRAFVGAASVVNRPVDADRTVVGVPARAIADRRGGPGP